MTAYGRALAQDDGHYFASDQEGIRAPRGLRRSLVAPLELHVDASADDSGAGAGSGAIGKPFRTVRQALARAAQTSARTVIRIHGTRQAGATHYHESGPICVGPNVSLIGDGPEEVVLHAGGLSSHGGVCAMFVDGGHVQGVSVSAYGGAAVVTSARGLAHLVHVSVHSSYGPGIVAYGSAHFQAVKASRNLGVGLLARGSGTIVIEDHAGEWSHFDENIGSGIEVAEGALIRATGITANSNVGFGIQLCNRRLPSEILRHGGTGSGFTRPFRHRLNSVELRGNRRDGLFARGAAEVSVRRSRLYGNGGAGLRFQSEDREAHGLDIGFAESPGRNFFADLDTGRRNHVAGLVVEGTDTFPVEASGNYWANSPTVYGNEIDAADVLDVVACSSVDAEWALPSALADALDA